MKKYLSTLHTRSENHKKRFAFLVSGGFTLMIFSLWSLATFGTGGTLEQGREVVAQKQETKEEVKEVSPLSSLKGGIATGFAGLSEALEGIFGGLKGAVDLNNYGR